MVRWLVVWLGACAPTAQVPVEEPPSAERAAGEPVGQLPSGTQLVRKEGKARLHNSIPGTSICRVVHPQYEGREVFIDGVASGTLPLSAPIETGTRAFGILVGPGDQLLVEKIVHPKPMGVVWVDLSKQ